MKRRDLIKAFAGATISWPLAARSQQSAILGLTVPPQLFALVARFCERFMGENRLSTKL
ncbi:MAG TPA: hypothetical protein VGV62_03555 [Xanthobacteraceae bacterium]|jgi:hypothetical protein|nr:hypothetical protein [Xanthobacteraceae bacterium]